LFFFLNFYNFKINRTYLFGCSGTPPPPPPPVSLQSINHCSYMAERVLRYSGIVYVVYLLVN